VATIVREARRPGSFVERWSGLNDAGRPVPSGVYFARLSVANAPALTRKLVLLK
jgi:hypothetical protein